VSPPTPRRIQTAHLPRAMRGYDRAETDRLLKDVAASYEELWLERKGLRQQVEQLGSEIEELRERDRLVSEALLSAERTAEQTRLTAQREAEATLEEAKAHAEEILRLAAREREQLASAVSRSRAVIERVRSDFSAILAEALDRLGPEEAVREPEDERGARGERGELLLLDDLTTKRQSAQE
jgi:cell division initiation protein